MPGQRFNLSKDKKDNQRNITHTPRCRVARRQLFNLALFRWEPLSLLSRFRSWMTWWPPFEEFSCRTIRCTPPNVQLWVSAGRSIQMPPKLLPLNHTLRLNLTAILILTNYPVVFIFLPLELQFVLKRESKQPQHAQQCWRSGGGWQLWGCRRRPTRSLPRHLLDAAGSAGDNVGSISPDAHL